MSWPIERGYIHIRVQDAQKMHSKETGVCGNITDTEVKQEIGNPSSCQVDDTHRVYDSTHQQIFFG